MEHSFHKACFHGDVAQVQALLRQDARLAAELNKHGATGLHQAAFRGHAAVVQELLALPNARELLEIRDADGATPIHNAVFNNHDSCVALLVRAGANVNAADTDQSTPLHKAAFAGALASLRVLLEAGCDTASVDVDRATALHKSAFKNHADCVTALVQAAPALLPTIDRFGSSPLHKAAYNGSAEALQVLVAAGADVALLDAQGYAPLHLAARKMHVRCIAALVACSKCDVDQRSGSGDTALHCASRAGSVECVQALVDAGARVDAPNGAGETPLVVADAVGKAEVALVLRAAGGKDKGEAAMEPVVTPAAAAAAAAEELSDADDNFDGDGGSSAPLDPVALLDRWGFVVLEAGRGSVQSTPAELAHKAKELTREWKWLDMRDDARYWTGSRRRKLRARCLKGIPDSMRMWAWPRLAEVDEARKRNAGVSFQELSGRTEKTKILEYIHRDLHRTFPTHWQFRNKAGKTSLLRVLRAYSFHNPKIGYCQGMGFVTAMFLMYTVTEEEAFWMLVQMVDKYRMGGLWDEQLADVGKMCQVHTRLLRQLVPRVHAHLERHEISSALYAPSYYITGFAYSLPWPCVLRVWDAFLSDGIAVLHATSVALMAMYQELICKLPFDELLPFLKFSHTGLGSSSGSSGAAVSHVDLAKGIAQWLPKVRTLGARFENEWDADKAK